jgi:hypothetical protein
MPAPARFVESGRLHPGRRCSTLSRMSGATAESSNGSAAKARDESELGAVRRRRTSSSTATIGPRSKSLPVPLARAHASEGSQHSLRLSMNRMHILHTSGCLRAPAGTVEIGWKLALRFEARLFRGIDSEEAPTSGTEPRASQSSIPPSSARTHLTCSHASSRRSRPSDELAHDSPATRFASVALRKSTTPSARRSWHGCCSAGPFRVDPSPLMRLARFHRTRCNPHSLIPCS